MLLAGLWSASPAEPQERLASQVRQLIAGQRGLRIYDWVGFSIDSNTVTLGGFVTAVPISEGIERSVRALESVTEVRNEIEVLPHDGNDIGIRVNAYWRIYGHPEIRQLVRRERRPASRVRRGAGARQTVLVKPIHIVVRDGHLVLEGELPRRRQKRVAGEQAEAVLGVRSVTNNIVVTGADTEELDPIDLDADPWWVDSDSVAEPVVRIENPAGAVRVEVSTSDRVLLRRTARGRQPRPDDTSTERFGRKMRIRGHPSDGAPLDLDVEVPYGHRLEVDTVDGPIHLAGLVRGARLKTGTGEIVLSAPWRAVRLTASSRTRPDRVEIPERLRASLTSPGPAVQGPSWSLEDVRDPRSRLYGAVHVEGRHPRALVLRDVPIPRDSPVRMHWQAPDTLSTMLRRPFRMRLTRPQAAGEPGPGTGQAAESSADFTSEVRLVQLSAAVLDARGRPLRNLGPRDFSVMEDDIEQQVTVVHDSDAEFNLVLLLDCSTSTLVDRDAVMEAARRFVSTARPRDRVAIYVLADAYLRVVSPLTADRDRLLGAINRIPRLSGGTPLYDAIVLSYARELARRRWERNAIIVISDGMDNDLLPRWSRSVPSEVPFGQLLRAAAEMNSAVYPIFLEPEPPGIRSERTWRQRMRRSTNEARDRMGRLAQASGGRLFPARSIRDLDTVYEQVAQELRSVYTLGYYPTNQVFDGAWRHIRVTVDGGRTRTRSGYYGW